MTGRPRTLGLFAAALVPLGLTVAACANTEDQAASPSRTVSAPSTPLASGSSAPSQPSASPSPTAAAPCSTAELKVRLGPGGVAAGTWAALLEFTNSSAAACTMTGWPAVAGITAAGTSTSATNRSGFMDGLDAAGTPHVTLQPGQQAGIDISGADSGTGGGDCPPPYRRLRVSAPGDSASVTVPADPAALAGGLPSCGTLAVSPVHPRSDFSFSGQ